MSEAGHSAAGQGPSIEQITAARNSAIGRQQAMAAPESQRVANELEHAHKDALHIKAQHDSDTLRDQVQASSAEQADGDNRGVLGAAKSAVQTMTSIFSGGADSTSGGGDGGSVRQQEAGDAATKQTDVPVEEKGGPVELGTTNTVVEAEGVPEDADEMLGHGTSHDLMHVLGSLGSPVMPTPYEPWSKAADATMSHLLGSGRMIPTPVEPTGERHLGDDEPDMPSADEQAAMRAQLADEPASLGEGMSHSHGVGEVGAGANSVETASRASHGLVDTVKGAVSSLFTGPSPPPEGTDAGAAVRQALGDLPVGADTPKADAPDTPSPDTADNSTAGNAALEAMDRATAPAADESAPTARMGLPELLASVVTNVAKNVGIATNQEEVLAGDVSPDPDVPEAPAGSFGAAAVAQEAGDRADEMGGSLSDKAQNAATDVKDKAGETVEAAKDKTADAANAARDTAASAADQARGAAQGAKETVSDAVGSAQDKAEGAKDAVGNAVDSAKERAQEVKDYVVDSLEGAKQRTQEAAEGAVDKAADTARSVESQVYGASDAVRGKTSDAADAARDTAGSAADQAAGAAASVRDTASGVVDAAKEKASDVTDVVKDKASDTADAAKQNTAGVADASKHEQEQGKGLLARAWEELTHGGAKAPRAVTQGETEASQDVTSNQERSKHLDDSEQKRIYEGEAYKVAPGSQASDAQAVTDQQRERGEIGNVVAGDKRQVTGTVPHGKPEGPAPAAGSGGQPDRFKAGGGTYSGFGTGSAAPRRGNDDIKSVQALFYPPMVDEQELPMRLNTDNRSPRTSDVTAVEGAGDGSGMDDDQPSHEVDEEIPVSPAGLLGSVGGSWGRSWVAKAAGPKTERFRPADVPYDPEADARNDAEARAAYDHARQTTYGSSGYHKDQHGDTSHASASEAAKASREDFREAGKHAAESAAYTRDALGHGVDTAKKAAQEEAEAVREQVGKAVNTAQHKAQGAKQAVRETVDNAAERTRENAEAAAETLRQQKDYVKGAVASTADAAREKAAQVADNVQDKAHHLAESAEDAAWRARQRVADTAGSAEEAARRARDRVSETAEEARHRAHDAAQSARHKASDIKDTITADAERAVEEARDRTDRAGAVLREEAQETKRAASGAFSSLGDAFKGLLSGLLSPFEKEAAPMDERTTAVHAGTPLTRNSEPVPEEQLGVDERVKLNAARHYATKEYMSHGEPLARRAESRVHEAEERAGSLLGQVVDGAHDLKEKAKGRAEELADKAREGYEKGEQKIKRAVDDGVDRAGEVKERAAGVISRLEETLESVSRTVTDALQDFVEGDTERVWLAPPSNTEDVLRMRQKKRLQDQGMDRQVDRMVSTLSDELRDVVEGRRTDDYVWAMPPSNTEDVLQMRAQATVNNQMDRRFF